jgi:dienelactone hydrolase
MGLLYGRAGRLTALFGGSGPGQYIDPKRIYVAGFALGGTVALHAAALDRRIAGVASFAGFTPMRNDSPGEARRVLGGL